LIALPPLHQPWDIVTCFGPERAFTDNPYFFSFATPQSQRSKIVSCLEAGVVSLVQADVPMVRPLCRFPGGVPPPGYCVFVGVSVVQVLSQSLVLVFPLPGAAFRFGSLSLLWMFLPFPPMSHFCGARPRTPAVVWQPWRPSAIAPDLEKRAVPELFLWFLN